MCSFKSIARHALYASVGFTVINLSEPCHKTWQTCARAGRAKADHHAFRMSFVHYGAFGRDLE